MRDSTAKLSGDDFADLFGNFVAHGNNNMTTTKRMPMVENYEQLPLNAIKGRNSRSKQFPNHKD